MNNDVVIVMEDPAEWDAFVHAHNSEPETAEERDFVPFFKTEGDNSRFSERELLALKEQNAPFETVLVKTNNIPIAYSQLSTDMFNSEFQRVGFLIQHFLNCLGGFDVKYQFLGGKQIKDSKREKKRSNGRFSTPVGGGQVGVESESALDSNFDERVSIDNFAERTTSDFDKASEYLECDPLLKMHFGPILYAVRQNLFHGKKEGSFDWHMTSEVLSKFKKAIDASGKYKLVEGGFKKELEAEMKHWEHKHFHYWYSLELP